MRYQEERRKKELRSSPGGLGGKRVDRSGCERRGRRGRRGKEKALCSGERRWGCGNGFIAQSVDVLWLCCTPHAALQRHFYPHPEVLLIAVSRSCRVKNVPSAYPAGSILWLARISAGLKLGPFENGFEHSLDSWAMK